jgi:NADH:ubiquinone oxidoreductase subunit 3 (subunit A)
MPPTNQEIWKLTINLPQPTKTAKTLLVALLFLIFLLMPATALQAGRNIFRPEKNPDSSDEPAVKIRSDQIQHWEQISRSIEQGNSTFSARYYLFVAIILVLIGILSYLLQKFYSERHERLLNDPLILFQELCTVHQLTLPEQQLLQNVAKDQELNNPLSLFIEPQHIRQALNNPLFEKFYIDIEILLTKLFDLIPETKSIQNQSDNNNTETTIVFSNEN